MNAPYVMPMLSSRASTILVLIGAVGAFVALVYADSFASMARVWTYSDHRYGMLVFPISAYLLWRARASIAGIRLRPWAPGLGLLVGLVFAWLVCHAAGIQAAEHLIIILMIPTAVATYLGVALVRAVLFPLIFLAAAVPVGDVLVPYLMRITAEIAAALLALAAVPVFRDGQFFTLPGGNFEVADVCSGMRYLVSGTMIALLFSYLTFTSYWKRAVFVLVTSLTFVLANGIRAFIVMFVASATEMRVLGGKDHIYFGWLLFAIVLGALLWAGSRHGETSTASDDRSPSLAAGVQTRAAERGPRVIAVVSVLGLVMLALTAQPMRDDLGSTWLLLFPASVLSLWAISRRFIPRHAEAAERPAQSVDEYLRGRPVLVVFLASVVLVAGPTLLQPTLPAEAKTPLALELPAMPGCGRAGDWEESWEPELRLPETYVRGTYRCADRRINVVFAAYARSVQGDEMVNDGNTIVPASWRGFAAHDVARFIADGERPVEVNEIRVSAGGRSALIWFWYRVGDRNTASATIAKMFQAWQIMTRRSSGSAVYFLETHLSVTPERDRAELAFAARALEAALGPGGSGDEG